MKSGYSLIELVIALSISSLVLAGILSVASSALRFSIQGSTRGDVTGWTLVSLNQMHKELENASFIATPTTATAGGSSVIDGCSGYHSGFGQIEGSTVAAFYYCVADVGSPVPVQSLLRYTGTSCPIATPTCGSGSFTVVAKQFYKQDPDTPFFQSPLNQPNGIEMHYIVGIATPNLSASGLAPTSLPPGSGQNNPNPQYLKVDTVIKTNRVLN